MVHMILYSSWWGGYGGLWQGTLLLHKPTCQLYLAAGGQVGITRWHLLKIDWATPWCPTQCSDGPPITARKSSNPVPVLVDLFSCSWTIILKMFLQWLSDHAEAESLRNTMMYWPFCLLSCSSHPWRIGSVMLSQGLQGQLCQVWSGLVLKFKNSIQETNGIDKRCNFTTEHWSNSSRSIYRWC